jgi:pSer/pThr/pTyr-binding forkhead associated (FHA) protein
VAPARLSGQAFGIEKDVLSIGRAEGNDVRLENRFVSRHHAVVRRAGSALVIEDAGSTGGLLINGIPATEPALLHTGDRIRIGEVELELVGSVGHAVEPGLDEHTMVRVVPPALAQPPARSPTPRSREARFAVDGQRAGTIHNVAGSQYSIGNQYNVASLALLEPMRRRARWVMRVGFTLILLGFEAYVAAGLIWGSGITKCFNASETTMPRACLHPGALVLALAGVASIGFGVIVVIISLFMRREVRKEEARLERSM